MFDFLEIRNNIGFAAQKRNFRSPSLQKTACSPWYKLVLLHFFSSQWQKALNSQHLLRIAGCGAVVMPIIQSNQIKSKFVLLTCDQKLTI